jgi:hypothetical protein
MARFMSCFVVCGGDGAGRDDAWIYREIAFAIACFGLSRMVKLTHAGSLETSTLALLTQTSHPCRARPMEFVCSSGNIHLHAPMRLSATPEGQSTRDMMAPTRSGDGQATFCKNSVVVCDANGKLTRDATDPFEQIYRGAVCCGLFAAPLSRRPNRPTPVAYTASASPSQMS